MRKIVLILSLCLSINAFAGFGGGRGGGGGFSGGRSSSFSSARSSSFGGSRGSMGAPVTISRPTYSAPSSSARSYSPPVSTHTETIIHRDSGPGFFTGMLMGSVLNHNSAPVVVAPGGMGAPVVVEQRSSFSMIFEILIWVGLLALVVFIVTRFI